ncbi:MAG: hypothetical protein HY275_18730 [Gemmatimonadetes bacterium]|nr:hypothetical protein [Gemmatimonadota bacterium]
MAHASARRARWSFAGGARCARHAALLVVAIAMPAAAQQPDSGKAGVRTPSAPLPAGERDARARTNVRTGVEVKPREGPPISPGAAFLSSLLVPGLGQARLDRPVAGALYAAVELTGIAMLHKTWIDEREAVRYRLDSIPLTYALTPAGSAQLDSLGRPVVATWAFNRFQDPLRAARRANAEDWTALLLFNHFFSGADAFVAAQLWDLPANVAIRWLPGGPMVQAAMRWHW